MIHRMTAIGLMGLFLSLFTMSCQIMAKGVTLHRCNIDGEIEFRQTACEAGEETLQHVSNTSSGVTPSEPGLRLKKASEKSDTVSRRRPQPVNEKACWSKRRLLDRVESRLRTGYKASQYQRLHERQQEYEDYIRRFCY